VYLQVTSSLKEVLLQCDVLVNTLPSTPHTSCMLTHSLLQEAATSTSRGGRPAPLFINIGRGDVISTTDLLAALGEEEGGEEGEEAATRAQAGLSYAVLDVVEEEPLPPSSPLWTHPRVYITPHISAISTPDLVMGVFLDNLERFL
jgi:phosphoglycerate dehydrogenase-like enzyme